MFTTGYKGIGQSTLFDIYFGKGSLVNPSFGLHPVVSLSNSQFNVDSTNTSNNGISAEKAWKLIRK